MRKAMTINHCKNPRAARLLILPFGKGFLLLRHLNGCPVCGQHVWEESHFGLDARQSSEFKIVKPARLPRLVERINEGPCEILESWGDVLSYFKAPKPVLVGGYTLLIKQDTAEVYKQVLERNS